MNNNRRYLGLALTAAVLVLIGYYFSTIISWIIIAWVVSLLGSPLMNLLGKVRLGKYALSSSLRAVLVLLAFYAVLGLLISIFVPVIIQQGRNLAGINYALISQKLEEPLQRVERWFVERGLLEGNLPEPARDTLSAQDSLTVKDTSGFSNPGYTEPKDSSGTDFPTVEVRPGGVQFDPILSTTTIAIDSILLAQGDTVTKTNINLHLRIWLPDAPPAEEPIDHDTTAVVRPHDSPFEKLQKQVISFLNPAQIPKVLSAVVAWLGNLLVLLASVTFIAFFFLKDEQLFGRGIKAAIPDRHLPKVDAALHKIRRLLRRYFVGILLQMTSITVLLSILLGIFGIKNALLIAFFAAIMNVVPYIGPIIGFLFAALISISSNLDVNFYEVTIPMLVNLTICFAITQAVDNFVLQPVIFSNSVMAHPLEIFIIIIVGASMGSISGMVLAVPTYTIFRVIGAAFLSEFKIVQSITQNITTEEDQKQPPPPEEQQI